MSVSGKKEPVIQLLFRSLNVRFGFIGLLVSHLTAAASAYSRSEHPTPTSPLADMQQTCVTMRDTASRETGSGLENISSWLTWVGLEHEQKSAAVQHKPA